MNKVFEMKSSAANFGFDAAWIADVLEKWGDDVLALVIEAARNGLSVAWIVEIVDKFGPTLLEFVVSLLNRWKMAAAPMGFAAGEAVVVPGPVVEGVNAAFIDMIVEKYLPLIIEKYLPIIMEKYGPQLIQFLVDMFLKNLNK